MAGIDRIGAYTPNDNGAVTRRVQDADASKDDSGFRLLSEEAGGVIYEPEERTEAPRTLAQIREETAREEAAAARANLHARFDGPGVAVELSTDGVEASGKPAQQSIGSIFRDAWRAIVDFFMGIWNGGDEKPAGAAPADASPADAVQGDEPATDDPAVSALTAQADAPESSRSTAGPGTAEEIAAFMADYGGRHLAKNSDLLNRYDRTGHIVDVDPTDRRRILQGEGRVRRY